MTRLNPFRRSLALLGAASTLLLGACSKDPPAPTASESATAADKTKDAPANKHGKRSGKKDGNKDAKPGLDGLRARVGGGGVDALFDTALSELELTDEQRTNIEALQKEAKPERRGREDRQAVMKVLAEGVRKGAVDEKAAQAEVDSDRTAREAEQVKSDAALQKLHASLDEGQRKKVSDALLAKMENHGNKGDKRSSPDTARRVDMILRGVEVTPEKHKALEEALVKAKLDAAPENDMDAAIARKRATIEAFAKPDFNASANRDAGDKNTKMTDLIQTLAVVTPLLDEAQRTELADRLEQGKGRRDEGAKRKDKLGAAPGENGPRGKRGRGAEH